MDDKSRESVAKPLHKQIAEHKDVTKIVINLNGILSGMKPDANEVLKEFKKFEELWASVSVIGDQVSCSAVLLIFSLSMVTPSSSTNAVIDRNDNQPQDQVLE